MKRTTVYCGVDLHRDSLTICLMTGSGKRSKFETLPTKCRNRIRDFFVRLQGKASLHVAVESVGFYQWFWDLVQPLVDKMVLANASGVRAAAGRRAKTDRNDAETLARLLRQDSLPMAFVPDLELREFRALVRHRERIRRRISSCKGSMRMEMHKLNYLGPKELNSGSFHKWYAAQHRKLPPISRMAFEDLAEQLLLFEKQMRNLEDRLSRTVEDNPRFKAHIDRYMTLPGVGLVVAAVLLAETGNLLRFDLEQEIISYAGLAPRTFQSANTCRHGRIGKDGPPILRRCLIQAAWTAVRSNPGVKKRFERWTRSRGKKKAIVKVAAKILGWAWAMERRNEDFDPARLAA